MINIVKNIDNANFVTHAGKFHADEIFATILLEEIYGEINLIRLPEVDGLNLDNKFVYDIGGGEFDHHQIGGNGQRNSGIKYAAFGLVWKAFGRKFLEQKNANNIEDCFYMFDKNFVQFIDAGDNGQIKYENIDIKLVTLSDVIEGFNPNWNEDIDSHIEVLNEYHNYIVPLFGFLSIYFHRPSDLTFEWYSNGRRDPATQDRCGLSLHWIL